jgi:hypothetical protein
MIQGRREKPELREGTGEGDGGEDAGGASGIGAATSEWARARSAEIYLLQEDVQSRIETECAHVVRRNRPAFTPSERESAFGP